jgi:hypothetical protein
MRLVTALALVAAFAAACGGAPAAPTAEPTPRPTPTIGKYTQTWRTASYADTTCVHWVDDMNSHERFVMAADMLMGAQRSQVPGSPIPPDWQVNRLLSALDEFCADTGYSIPSRVSDLVTTLYLMSDDLKP